MTPREKAIALAKTIGVVESAQAEFSTVSTAALLDLIERALITLLLPIEGCNLEKVEEVLMVQALVRTEWNQTRAARLVGLTRDQLRYRMRSYRIPTNR